MLAFLLLLMLQCARIIYSGNAGSSIFYNKQAETACWNENDIAKLRSRETFEQIIPPLISPDKVDRNYIKNTLRYFKRALRSVEDDSDANTAAILKEALADTIGAHLRSEILPNVRFAYYAGYVPYRITRQFHDFLDELKQLLNTQGLGWKPPERIPRWTNLTVAKIVIGAGKFFDPCSTLVTKRDSNSCIHLPTPKLDDDNNPGAIALPFKSGGLISLFSQNSNKALLKYYTTASRCILTNSPEHCRHPDFINFNNELWHWMKRDVAPHLADEKLYAAYGSVLRIAAAVQNYGRSLSRRNLFDIEDPAPTKWHPWKRLKKSYVYVNTDWSSSLYICVVLLLALGICFLQICTNYVFGENICLCRSKQDNTLFSKEVSYANVETKFPAILPHQSAVFCSDLKRVKRTASKSKTASLGSICTQKVYDMNENTEKLMAVIMSDEGSIMDFPTKGSEEESVNHHVIDVGKMKLKGPPEIETTISQIKPNRSPRTNITRVSSYSTSTVTPTEAIYQHHSCDSISSVSGSSIIDQSYTSSSKWRRSRSSRDLAWALRVSKQSIRSTNSTSKSELNSTSTTPPSKQLH